MKGLGKSADVADKMYELTSALIKLARAADLPDKM